ncbi:MAG: hypothetical protein LBK41_07360 [Clostridiales bacterium]|nr:hypothetical protein [Clostridiales bacterium]
MRRKFRQNGFGAAFREQPFSWDASGLFGCASLRERTAPICVRDVENVANTSISADFIENRDTLCTSVNAPVDGVPMFDFAASGRVGDLSIDKQRFRKAVLVESGIEAQKPAPIGFASRDFADGFAADFFKQRQLFFSRRIRHVRPLPSRLF